MTAHLVTVFGRTQAGKDTLISRVRAHLLDRRIRAGAVSSIDHVKSFFRAIVLDSNSPEPKDQEMRQALADTKAIIDRTFNWTVNYGIWNAKHPRDKQQVIFYQVRELENLSRLRTECEQQNIDYLSAFVFRPGNSAHGATTDRYDFNACLPLADAVIINTSLEDLDRQAISLAETLMRRITDEYAR